MRPSETTWDIMWHQISSDSVKPPTFNIFQPLIRDNDPQSIANDYHILDVLGQVEKLKTTSQRGRFVWDSPMKPRGFGAEVSRTAERQWRSWSKNSSWDFAWENGNDSGKKWNNYNYGIYQHLPSILWRYHGDTWWIMVNNWELAMKNSRNTREPNIVH